MTLQASLQRAEQMQALLAQRGQVAAGEAKGESPLLATKGAGGFLHFGHTYRTFEGAQIPWVPDQL